MSSSTTSQQFFEAKYAADQDPWNFASSPSELARYDAILSALAGRTYQHAFEPACSVGVLTARLATISARVSAFDLSPTAVARANERCASLPHVDIRCATIADTLPDESVDLLVLSEVGYYFTRDEWTGLLSRLLPSCPDGCTVLAAHWLGSSPDHRVSGDEVHEILRASPLLQLSREERHETFRLDRFRLSLSCS